MDWQAWTILCLKGTYVCMILMLLCFFGFWLGLFMLPD